VGSPLYQVVCKLKKLKFAIKEWNKNSLDSPGAKKNSLDSPGAKIQEIRKKLEKLHNDMGSDPLNFLFQQEELKLQADLAVWLAYEEKQMKQKSRESWLQLGDRNTKFFYSVVKTKQAKNHIKHLINEKGEPVTDIFGIRVEPPDFFEKLFNQKSIGMSSLRL